MSNFKGWWFHGDGPNFGDVLAPYIVKKLTGKTMDLAHAPNGLVSIGSIIMLPYAFKQTIWGSGAICWTQRSNQLAIHDIRAVRGPKTRHMVLEQGGQCPEVYGDPGMLMGLLVDQNDLPSVEREIAILPHWKDYETVRKMKHDYPVIDIMGGIEHVLAEIAKSEIILSTSLHGLIVPEALGKKVCHIVVGDNLMGKFFKFEDYCQCTDREHKYVDYTGCDELKFEDMDMLWEDLNFDMRPLLRAFPYKMVNERVLEYMNDQADLSSSTNKTV